MVSARKSLIFLLLAVLSILLIAATLYQWGMFHFEGKERNFYESLEWATETLTTTGYGRDANWQHPVMIFFVIGLQITGIFLVFLVFPIFLIPFLEERFETKLPIRAPTKINDHILIYNYNDQVTSLIDELKKLGIPVLIVVEDQQLARRLFDREVNVIYGDLESGVLDAAKLLKARALITNCNDAQNAAVILAARQMKFTKDILSMVTDPYHRPPLVVAGATAVFTPHHMLGAALASQSSTTINPRIHGLQQFDMKLRMEEVHVRPNSFLDGKSLSEAKIGETSGATVIAIWDNGRLDNQPKGDTVLKPHQVLMIIGGDESLQKVAKMAGCPALRRYDGSFIIAGFGAVGQKVYDLLSAMEDNIVVVDKLEKPGIDFVGDMLDIKTLERIGVKQAQVVILALHDDSATLFATMLIKDISPDTHVIARVNSPNNVERIHRAGAHFALSISQVSSQVLLRHLVGEEAGMIDGQLKVSKFQVSSLTGKKLMDLKIRETTRCSIVAVERAGEMVLQLDGHFTFEAEDTIFICGNPNARVKFKERFL